MNRYTQYMYSYPHKTAYGPLSGIALSDYKKYLTGPGHSLYLHVPFCQSKCGYCNLFSLTGQKKETMDGYLDAVERQIRQYKDILSETGTCFSDLTIGGGTPLLFSREQLRRMFDLIFSKLDFQKERQVIIETAPNQTTREKLEVLKEAGVTRISMGIQSFLDSELETLGRKHRADQARSALCLLKEMDFPCLNLDFIYGIPGQTEASFMDSLKEALTFEPDELFLYPLYVRRGVAMEKSLREGTVLDGEQAFSQYRRAREILLSAGFRQDSMRRFVKAEKKRDYEACGFGTSLALGCGGRSYLGNLHFCTPYGVTVSQCQTELKNYMETEDFTRIRHGILLSEEEIKRRHLIRHLFIRPGLSLKDYREHFQGEAVEEFSLLKDWIEEGYLELVKEENPKGDTEELLSLTEEGMGLSDFLGPKLISCQVQKKMEEWGMDHGKTDRAIPGDFKKL